VSGGIAYGFTGPLTRCPWLPGKGALPLFYLIQGKVEL
jgi:hypothetical protein